MYWLIFILNSFCSNNMFTDSNDRNKIHPGVLSIIYRSSALFLNLTIPYDANENNNISCLLYLFCIYCAYIVGI